MINFLKGGDPPGGAPPSIELRYRVAAILAGAALTVGTVAAQPGATNSVPIVIDSALATIDDTTNTADFTSVSITQGRTRITAERAHATDLQSNNSRWTFSGRVTITSEQRGSLWADQAILEYRDGALDRILMTGAPARFEQRRADSGQADHGQADEITYEAKPATVRLRGHPHISVGRGLEMNAPMFVYHVRDGKLQAYSDNGMPEVHIVTKRPDPVVP